MPLGLPTTISQVENAPRPGSSRIPELDGLRGLAILLVLLYHFTANLGGVLYPLQMVFRIGWSGVDLFFVLSGFLIGGILIDAKHSARYFPTFYLRRFYRILPLYYVWISLFAIVMAGCYLWLPSLMFTKASFRFYPVHVLFLQNIIYVPQPDYGSFWLAALWSLAVEEQFYLIAPALIRWLATKALVGLLIASVVAAPILRVILYSSGHPGAMFSWMPSRADTLALGVLASMGLRKPAIVSQLKKRRAYLRGAVLFLFSVLVVLAVWFPNPESLLMASWGMSTLALFYACLMLWVLGSPTSTFARVARTGVLRKLGNVSYFIYVTHLAVYGTCYLLFLHFVTAKYHIAVIGSILLATPLLWAAAQWSWEHFEKPLIQIGHKYHY